MKKLLLLLLSAFVHADDHNHFTIVCNDKIKNKYRIALDLDTKKFTVLKSDTIISEGSIAKINSSKNSIEFKLLEINTKDNKKIFTSNNLLRKLICNI